MKLFFTTLLMLVYGGMCCALIGIGALCIFGSLFFEETRSQLTWEIVRTHIFIFLGGLISVATGITMAIKGMELQT